MSWDDTDFGLEYAKFKEASPIDAISSLYNGKVEVLYCKPYYDTISEYISMWNKRRMKIEINKIRISAGTPLSDDSIITDTVYSLDMGARLYNTMKKARASGFKLLKIIKISNPNDKFDVEYYAHEYKLIKQQKINKKK